MEREVRLGMGDLMGTGDKGEESLFGNSSKASGKEEVEEVQVRLFLEEGVEERVVEVVSILS